MLNLLDRRPRLGRRDRRLPVDDRAADVVRATSSRGYAESIAEKFPDATVGLFYVNNEFGNVYIDDFREAADEAGLEIVSEQTIERATRRRRRRRCRASPRRPRT